ncbi:hypothetical protein ADEAN_000250300 [Angomonas deanei]|uniref:Uncharacterized protein n=1 Tax=Angomonas deanei TaxID=59799 RepID=A0A7G2C5P1_9TRYP|nr:hypothetical protein ADEAN_000250300 [Angomonas deanei]
MPVSKRGRSTGEGNTEEDHLIHLEATSRKRRLPIPNHNDVGPVAFYFVANQHISVNRSWQSQSAGTALIEGNFWFKCRVCTWCYSACRQGIERDEPARLFSRLCGEEDRLNSIPPTESPWNFFGHLLFSSQPTNSSRAPSTAGQSATDAQNSSSNSTTKNSVMVSPIITGAGGDEPPRSPLRKVQLDIAARKERKIGLILLDERRLKVDENECVGDTPNALNSSVSPILEDTSDEHHLGPFPTTERSVSSCYDVITALLDERHGKRRKDDMWGVVSPTSPPVSGTRRGSGSFRAAAAKRSDSAPNVRASSYIVRDASFSLESSFHAYTPAALNPQPARSSSRDHILSTSVVKGV